MNKLQLSMYPFTDFMEDGAGGGVFRGDSRVRRSTRRKKRRGEREFVVSSDTLLRDLKVQVNMLILQLLILLAIKRVIEAWSI